MTVSNQQKFNHLIAPLRLFSDLSLYVAGGVTALGWTVTGLLGIPAAPYVPLWFAGVLCVYTLNRLVRDPADPINIPERCHRPRWLVTLRRLLLLLTSLFLIIWPLLRQDLPLLMAVGFAAISGICYNIAMPHGPRRLKSLPVAKTFLPALVAVGAILVYPVLCHPTAFAPHTLAPCALWLGSLLLINVILCDRRDLHGDMASGVISLPGWLGPAPTQRLLTLLIAINAASGLAGAWATPQNLLTWLALGTLLPAYLAVTVRWAPQIRSPYTFEWLVDGMLFIPAGLWLLTRG